MRNNNGMNFVSGAIFGLVAGAVAGVLLAPKSGEETREDLKKFASDMGDKASAYYSKAKKEVEKKISALKAAGEKIDESKYKDLVDSVLAEIKKDGEVTADVAKSVGTQLKTDWAIVKEALVK